MVHRITQLCCQVYNSRRVTRSGVRVSELGFQICQAIKYVGKAWSRSHTTHWHSHHKDAHVQHRVLQELTHMSTCERHMHRCANACLNMYRTHLWLNTTAETAPYIQDALVAKVYTSAMAALVQASACQVSAHICMGDWSSLRVWSCLKQ